MNLAESIGHLNPSDPSAYQTMEPGSLVAEIVESSRSKAQKMVNAAVQVKG